VTNKTAATRYARALFDVALREKANFDHLEQDLAAFAGLLTTYPALEKVLLNPAVPVPRKRAAVTELTTRAETAPMVAKLLALLAERDRLILVPDLLASFRDRVLTHRHVVRARVTTATALAADKAQAIETRLAAVTGRTIMLETAVDAAIIGGLIARVGSTVYDGSVTRQLQKMKDRLNESV
jgi:F-type H+-transporting ATPase subunit delta